MRNTRRLKERPLAPATTRITGAGTSRLRCLVKARSFGKTGRLIYTELAILRFLIGHGFKLLFSRNAAEATAWTKLTTQADQRSDDIIQELVSRRK